MRIVPMHVERMRSRGGPRLYARHVPADEASLPFSATTGRGRKEVR